MANPDSEQNIVYKVVRPCVDGLFSAVIDDQEWRVRYHPNIATRPRHPKSPLFVFRDLETAHRWVGSNNHIWKARAEGIRDPLDYIPQPTDIKSVCRFLEKSLVTLTIAGMS